MKYYNQSRSNVHLGVLSKDTVLNCCNGLKLTVKKGTLVIVKRNTVYFVTEQNTPVDKQPIKGFRVNSDYFIEAYGVRYLLERFTPRPCYPFSRLQ